MHLSEFDLKNRVYAGVTVLLWLLVEWVNDITAGVSAIILFLKGVL